MRSRSSVLTLCRQLWSAGRHGSALRWLRRAALPVVGMALVAFVVSGVVAEGLAAANQRAMARDVHHLVERFEQRFNDYAQVAVGVRSFWTVHQPLRHEDLAMYVAGLDLPTRYPGVQTVNLSERVPDGQDDRFDAQQRRAWQTYSHGQVVFERHGSVVLGDRTVRNFLGNGPDIGTEVITYLEPWQSFPYAVGRDLTQDPAMAAALRMARDQNVATAGSIIMAHTVRGESFPGLGIRLPLYQGPADTVDERRQHYVGSVGVGIRLDQFFNRVLIDNRLQYLDMQVFTIPTDHGTPESLRRWMVYDSRHLGANGPLPPSAGRWVQQESIDLGGYRVWAMFVNNGLPPNAYSPLWSVIAGVVTFATLFVLWVLVESAATARRRAMQLTLLATQDLEKQQAMTEQAAQMAGVGHWQLDVTHNRLTLSTKAEEILGFPRLPLHPKTWSEQLDPDDRVRWRIWFNDLVATPDNRDKHLEYRYRRGHEVVWLSIVGRRVDAGQGPVTLQGSLMDISQRKRNELDLRLKHRLGSIASTRTGTLDDSSGTMQDDLSAARGLFDTFVQRLAAELDMAAGRFWLHNPSTQRFEVQGTWVRSLAPRRSTPMVFEGWSDPDRPRIGSTAWAPSVTIEHRPEQILAVRMDWPVLHDGQAIAWLELYDVHRRDALASDLREPSIQQAIGQEAIHLVRYHAHYTHLHYLAGTDPLTGLMSRYRFGEALQERLKRTDVGHAVLFIDLDGFKKVNDSLGHAAGDQVLQDIAQRFRACLAPQDLIGRMGGDEFAVLTTTALMHDGGDDRADPEPVMALAQRLRQASEAPLRAQGRPCFLSASIGIALVPDDGAAAEDVIKRADIAMYAVKKTGKNGHQRYTPMQEKAAVLRNEIETALKEALVNQEMSLDYQPKFRLAPGQAPSPVGVESLLRWNHPTLGRVPPDTFIALAEDNGDIHALGQWVMRTVIGQMQHWDAQGLLGLNAAVNFSPRQFKDDASLAACLDQVTQAGLAPERITLEITEGCLMESPERSRVLLQRLHDQGFRIAIDDFGMGYSSLAYLKTFPVDEIKIDKTFVQNMAHSPQDVAIVDAILHMARRLGMEVVAEGVETPEQLALLQGMGCSLFQGFLFSKPLPGHEIPRRWTHP